MRIGVVELIIIVGVCGCMLTLAAGAAFLVFILQRKHNQSPAAKDGQYDS
ncbi:MAG: hypothetical protein JXB85_06885 [Anaerolineales bacterium]|nr:hypothetical protein [Anaerolineales bacterium]